MFGSTLLLITHGREASDAAKAAAERLFDGLLTSSQPKLIFSDSQALLQHAAAMPRCDAAWLFVGDDADDQDQAFLLRALLSERHLPAAVSQVYPVTTQPLRTDEPGQVELPLDAAPQVMQAVFTSLLAAGAILSSLSLEVRLLQAQSSGMAGQFDKIDEELRMAVKIQREFLPKQLPVVEGCDVQVLWRPAGYVSGDIYDVMRLDEHHLGLFIADAVGHGVPAALMTIYIKQAICTRQITPGIGPGYRIVPPGEALATLNRAMIEQDAGSASLGTAAYGIIDLRTQRLTFARAGHPAPLCLRGDGRTEWLEPDGAMLGIFPDEVFEELVIDLDDADRLLIYSDGFEVAFPAREGKGRLANNHFAAEFEGLRKGTPDEALAFLQQRLDLQAGSLNQRDDLTVIFATINRVANVAAARAFYDGDLIPQETAAR